MPYLAVFYCVFIPVPVLLLCFIYPSIYPSILLTLLFIVLHFVQCGPEYKLPGLYVVDSIVRQSRHQFGTEKDAFGPRFSKNFLKTFRNLFLCTPSDQVQFKYR